MLLRMHERMNGRRHKSTPAARFHPHLPLVRHERTTGEKKKEREKDNKKLNHESEQTRTRVICSIADQRRERLVYELKKARVCFLMGKEEDMGLL